MENSSRSNLWVSLALVALTLAVYWPVRTHGFAGLDDDDYVTGNIHVRNGFTPANVAWAFTSARYAVNWHPLTWLSHMLDCQLFGLRAGGPHLINVLLHAASAVALFLSLQKMTGGPSRTGNIWRSGFVAALFALHPLHVESVAWISERKDVLSGLFWMLTILFYIRYAERRTIWRYGLVLFVFALGLMAKPMLVTLPFVLLLLDWWPLGRFQKSKARGPASAWLRRGQQKSAGSPEIAPGNLPMLILEKIPLLCLSGVASFLVVHAQGGLAIVPFSLLPMSTRLMHSVAALMIYLEKTVWPANLAIYYPYRSVWPQWTVWPSAIGLAAMTAVVIWQARIRPWLAVGWFWFLGTMIPVIGLVQVGAQGRADRYTYIPLIGLFIALAWQLADLARVSRRLQGALATFGMLIMGACAFWSARQIAYWKDDLTLFSRAATASVNNAYAQDLGATALAKQGAMSEAITHWNIALSMDPGLASAHGDMAKALAEHGRFVEAIEQYKRALQLGPNYFEAQIELARIYATCPGHIDSKLAVQLAEQGCRTAGYEWPDYFDVLGEAYASDGRFEEAVAMAKKAAVLARAAGERDLPITIERKTVYYSMQRPYVREGE